MTAIRSRAGWPARRIAIMLAVLTLLLVATAAVLTAITGYLTDSGSGGTIALALTFLAAGYVVALRQPRNPVGWMLVCTGLSSAFTTAAGLYTRLDYGSSHGSLPLGRIVIFTENSFWPLALIIGMATVLLFPDGRLSAPWRRALTAYAVVAGLVVISQGIPGAVLAGMKNPGAIINGQLTTLPSDPAIRLLASGLPVLMLVPFWLAFIVRQVLGYRRASGDVRQQFKWFTAGAAVSVVGIVVLTVAESGPKSSGPAMAANVLAIYATAIAFPLAMGVAILRYRLYDIDRIISRTLAYAIVTGLLVGVYAGLVTLASLAGGAHQPLPVAIATLVAAALFSPLRRRVQRIVDRRFNRARYDAERTIAGFTARLQDAVELDQLSADLLTTVRGALEPAHAFVWLAGDQT